MQRFLQRFTDPNSREEENAGLDLNEPLYMQKLDEVRFTEFKYSKQSSLILKRINNIFLKIVSDQCRRRARVKCELQSHSDIWCRSVSTADLLPTGKTICSPRCILPFNAVFTSLLSMSLFLTGSHSHLWHGGQRALLRPLPRLRFGASDSSASLQRPENQKHACAQSRRWINTPHVEKWHACRIFDLWTPPVLSDIDQLITISGMVIRTSQLIPEMQEAFFRCQVCSFSARVEVDRGRIAEPAVCRNCNTTHSMALVHNRSAFSDKQMVGVELSGFFKNI